MTTRLSDLLIAPIREKLWHEMRQDLAKFYPDGRFLQQEWFDLEHLIPQQALKHDPDAVRINPETSKNIRAGNLLLCKKPLTLNGRKVYNNGCNSWKGRFYDKPISELYSSALQSTHVSDTHIIAALSLAYLAMVAKFGYVAALMRSGLLMREQFSSPRKFHRDLPHRSQMVMGGKVETTGEEQLSLLTAK